MHFVYTQSSEIQELKNSSHYDFVRVGADGVNFNTAFAKNFLGLISETKPAFDGTVLRNSIIKKALSLDEPREITLDAIQYADTIGTPINSLTKVAGIQGCVTGSSVSHYPDSAVASNIRAAIGQANYHIAVLDSDSGTYGWQAPSYKSFYNPTLAHVGNRNSWYRTHSHQSLVGKYIRDNVSKNHELDERGTIFNGVQRI